MQATVVVALSAVMLQSVVLLSHFMTDVTLQHEWIQAVRYTWPEFLGLSYAATGITHFTHPEYHADSVPPQGTWGLWRVGTMPVPWTGAALVLFGTGLVVGGLCDAFAPVYVTSPELLTRAGMLSDSAAAILLLTIMRFAPSTLYSFTHGKDGNDTFAARAALQVLWSSMLYQMAEGTFDELLQNAVTSSSSVAAAAAGVATATFGVSL